MRPCHFFLRCKGVFGISHLTVIYGEVLVGALIVLPAVILMAIVHQHNGLQPMLFDLRVANKKALIDISEPAM